MRMVQVIAGEPTERRPRSRAAEGEVFHPGACSDEQPPDLAPLHALTAAATEEFHALRDAFEVVGGEIETVAREEFAEDFAFVATAHGFPDADVEELSAERDR